MVKNVIFDMGNVLSVYDPQKYMRKLTDDAKAADAVARELFGGPEWRQLDAGTISEDAAVARVQARIPRYAAQVRRAMDEWSNHFVPMPGMQELVARLKAQGYGLYLLSNAGLSFFSYYKKAEVFRYFDGFVISAKEKLLKPDPALYRRLLDRYRLKAEECLFIDDLRENIEGAERVGIKGHCFAGSEELGRYLKRSGIL